ncbi:MAG: hypothetical protein Q7S27_05420 [Nanoarchaeota archaeon]|nr:hypothetical protein [Nanoarchaeota archaeon]
MANLDEKLAEYFGKGFHEHSRKDRGGISGYIMEIELRKENEGQIFLLYDPTKNRCRERTQKDINEYKQADVLEFLRNSRKDKKA